MIIHKISKPFSSGKRESERNHSTLTTAVKQQLKIKITCKMIVFLKSLSIPIYMYSKYIQFSNSVYSLVFIIKMIFNSCTSVQLVFVSEVVTNGKGLLHCISRLTSVTSSTKTAVRNLMHGCTDG